MAKYPFAEEAKATMAEAGISFNADGTTFVAEKSEQDTPDETKQDQITASADVDSEEPIGKANEQDKLLAIQREAIAKHEEEISQLRNQLANQNKDGSKTSRELELEAELTDLRSKLSDQTRAEQADEFRQLLEKHNFDSENLDDDALLEIRDRFIKPVAAKIDSLEAKLATYDNKFRDPTPEEKIEKIKQTTFGNIVKEIPDFTTIFQSKDFQEKLAKKDDRYPTATYGATLQIAYETGDHNFIIKEVKAFLNGDANQNISDVADVGASKGVSAGNQSATESDGFTYTDDEALEVLRRRQMGDLTAKQYSEYRANFEEHKSRKG